MSNLAELPDLRSPLAFLEKLFASLVMALPDPA